MTFQVTACPVCTSRELDLRPAVMAPFIARYVLDRRPERCVIAACRSCGLAFFQTRYDAAEVARLYDGYRGERYLAVRHALEPWYTRRFNTDIGGPAGMAPRQAVYRAAVAAVAETFEINTVLDYAGDRGQMMEGGPGREKFVFDISGVEPVAGVVSIADERDLAGRTFDLVLLCGVVEHFSAPLDAVRGVSRYVRPGGLLYIEVPDEQYEIDRIPRGRWYRAWLDFLLRAPWLLLLVDLWSTAVRVKLRAIPPLGFAKQHEHLNFFEIGSLTRLAKVAGLDLIACERAASSGAVIALCRRPVAPAESR